MTENLSDIIDAQRDEANRLFYSLNTDAAYALRQLRLALKCKHPEQRADCVQRAIDAVERVVEASATCEVCGDLCSERDAGGACIHQACAEYCNRD